MNIKDIQNLQEAYSQIYQVDEAKTSQTAQNDRIPDFETEKKAKQVPGLRVNKPSSPVEEGYNEEVRIDLFDYILEYLVSEGYANTNENALVIMANMSEEWRDNIVELYGAGFSGSAGFALSKPKSSGGGSATQQPQPRSREFEKIVPSRKPKPSGGGSATTRPTGPSSPGYDTRRIGGYDLRRLAK